jgi:hypothetical protein
LEPDPSSGARVFTARALGDMFEDDTSTIGFLYANSEQPWPHEAEEVLERLPDEWIEEAGGQRRVKRDYR